MQLAQQSMHVDLFGRRFDKKVASQRITWFTIVLEISARTSTEEGLRYFQRMKARAPPSFPVLEFSVDDNRNTIGFGFPAAEKATFERLKKERRELHRDDRERYMFIVGDEELTPENLMAFIEIVVQFGYMEWQGPFDAPGVIHSPPFPIPPLKAQLLAHPEFCLMFPGENESIEHLHSGASINLSNYW